MNEAAETVGRPTNEYLDFHEFASPSGKTKVVDVYNAHGHFLLGSIKWHGPWRQYTFWPTPGTLFNKGCMTTIIEYVDDLMEERQR